ncbi:MAG TPA: VWA domain-containing protein, partial [Elusimicrobiales bacterium]|nr:VWA domain-containing protein [Elusimicrobiales bacterium]
IGDAILVATNHIKKSKAKSKIMILLTDGRSNTGTVQDPLTAAKLTSEFDIKIYTIGTASKGPAQIATGNPLQPYITIDDDLNDEQLQKIADTTGGKFYRATSSQELEKIYSEIDRLEKTKFEVKYNTEVSELYNMFLIPAILFSFATVIIEKTLIMTVP